ncbi:MAG TPA: hypothetical protein VEI45_17070 [Mycobacterium sp.]|uniref:hypothetical protein n=1 Tax=Mycobacterium sp. TaxID=1785 RepID=UPI002D4088B5|nr:hypothetical protein [Mycobacterium sp.]HXY66016.1 hypothetical protein [Mycobacterium sp.]
MRDLDTVDSELRLVAALRGAARERGGPLPSIAVANARLDERREAVEGSTRRWEADAQAMRAEAAEPGRATAGIARLIRGRVVPRG